MKFHEARFLEGMGDDGYGSRVARCQTPEIEDGEEDVLVGVCGLTFGFQMGGVSERGELVREGL